MPLLIAALWGAFISALGTMVGQILVSLAIGYTVYTGVDTSIGWARDFMLGKMSALPALSLQVAGMLQIGRCVSILTSALVLRMTLQGLKSGTIKKMSVK